MKGRIKSHECVARQVRLNFKKQSIEPTGPASRTHIEDKTFGCHLLNLVYPRPWSDTVPRLRELVPLGPRGGSAPDEVMKKG